MGRNGNLLFFFYVLVSWHLRRKTQQIGEYSVVGMERHGIVFCLFLVGMDGFGIGDLFVLGLSLR